MRRISLNPQNKSFPPARDDGTIALSDLEYFLASDPHPRFRLATASSAQLIEAGIILKRGEQGVRLTRFYVEHDFWVDHGQIRHGRWLESAAVVFPVAASETPELNAAPHDTLSAIWCSIADKLKRRKRLLTVEHEEVNVDGIRWE